MVAKIKAVNKETGQASLLNADGNSVLGLVRHGRNVKNARDSRSHEPRTTDDTVDDHLHS